MNKQMEGFDSTLDEYYLVTSSGNLIVVANEAERDKMIQDNTKKTPISDINNAKDIVSGEKFKQEFSQLLETSLGANESEKKEKLITLLSDSLNALSKETEKSKKDEIKKTYINQLNEILGTPKDDESENIKKIREKFSDSLSSFSSVSNDTKKLANTDLSKKTIISEDGIEYILECPFEKEDFFIADNHNVDLNDTDGFQRAIQEGTFFFARFKENSVTGEQELRTEGWDVLGGGAISSELDKTDDAAAEAEYKAVTDRIQAIDKKLELRIDQLETERDAVQTEMDSVSKTLEDNIERSFKVFG